MANDIPLSILRSDIINPDLLEEPPRIIASYHYSAMISNAQTSPTGVPRITSKGEAKNIVQVMDLIKDAIENYETRTSVPNRSKVKVVYEDPDKMIEFDTISISIEKRQPGLFGQGKPFDNSVGAHKNLRPVLREEGDDPDNPGYRRAVLGYWHDNIIRLTCWSLTNKEANARMLWTEEIMEQYNFYIGLHGTNRFLYWQHPPQVVKIISNNRIYGRPIDFFVRTETIRAVTEKSLEEIYMRIAARQDENI